MGATLSCNSMAVSPVYHTEWHKKVPDHLLVCGLGDLCEGSEWYQIDPRWSGESLRLIQNQFGIIQVLQRSSIPQTSNWSGTFFSSWYKKTALKGGYPIIFESNIGWSHFSNNY